ncbi:Trimethylguanosine synthase, partial [Trichostrongylus colubriformis]
MEDIDSTIAEDFRFPWNHLADFYAVFHKRNPEDETVLDYDCCLSRVHLNDKDLVKLSERKRVVQSADADQLADTVAVMGLSDYEDNDGALTLLETGKETVTTENDEQPLELKADAWAELPKSFGSTKKRDHSKFYRKRKKTIDDAQRWLKNTTFEEYWEDSASYLIYRTWYEDYSSIMNEDDRNTLAKQIEECKPLALIHAHTDDHISKYFGLTKDVKFSTYEELFAKHSEMVMKLAEKDFDLFHVELTSHRCKTFLKKIEKMGFVPGYNKSDIISSGGEATDPYENESPDKKKSKREHERRFPVIYSDDEIFSDIYYDIYDPYAASMSVVLDRKEKSREEDPTVDNPVIANKNDAAESKNESSCASSAEGGTDVSFAFDPVRDAHLVAKNAYDAYRDDE